MSKITYTYVACKDFTEFNELRELHTKKGEDVTHYHMITDDAFLRGRYPGIIVEYGRPHERWDWQGILEEIERSKRIWKDEFGFDQDNLPTKEEESETDNIYGGFEKM